jgi:hypothetical protein
VGIRLGPIVSTFDYGYFGGWWGFPAAQPVQGGRPADRETPAEPTPAVERKGGPFAGAWGNCTPGYAKAPAGNYRTWQFMSAHPTLAFMFSVVTDTILAGTRQCKVKDGNGKGVRKPPVLVGDGIISSPEDRWAETLDATHRDLWPVVLPSACRKLQYGHSPGEPIWERRDGLTLVTRYKPWRPWEVGILYDDFRDFAGVRYQDEDRSPLYAVNFVNEPDLYPLTGRPRHENCREEWWDKILNKQKGMQLDHKATSIVPSVLGPETEEGVETGKNIAAAMSRGEWTYMTYWDVPEKDIRGSAPDAWKRERFKIILHDLGETAPHSLALLENRRYLDAELAYGWLIPPQAAMEGQQHGAKAVAAVHGQLAVQGMECLHADLLGEWNAGPVRSMTLTNRGPAEAERYYFEADPLADPQQDFLQKLVLALAATPGDPIAGPMDRPQLLKRVEVPTDPNFKPPPELPTGPTTPEGGPGGNGQQQPGVNGNGNADRMRQLGLSAGGRWGDEADGPFDEGADYALALNCGTGAGGFHEGNTCAKGGGGGAGTADVGTRIISVQHAKDVLAKNGIEKVEIPPHKYTAQLLVSAVEQAKARGWKLPSEVTQSGGSAVAYMSGDSLGIGKVRLTAERAQGQVDAKFWSQPNPIVHELAHLQHESAVGERYGRLDNWMDNDKQRPIAERVSKYARVNPKEFVAETLAGMASGKTYDDDVMRLYKMYGGPSL